MQSLVDAEYFLNHQEVPNLQGELTFYEFSPEDQRSNFCGIALALLYFSRCAVTWWSIQRWRGKSGMVRYAVMAEAYPSGIRYRKGEQVIWTLIFIR